MSKEGTVKMNPNVNVYNVNILGREVTIETTFHPDRNPEQTTYSVRGNFKGTHLIGGLGGVTLVNESEELLNKLKEDIEDWMVNPRNLNMVTS